MTHPFGTNNPGIGGLDELTSAEEAIVASIASLGSSGQLLAVDGAGTGVEWVTAAGTGDMLAATYDPGGVAEQLVGLTATQTLTNKTLTTPTLTLKQSAAPTPTAEGDIQWDTDDNTIKIGDGVGAKTFSSDSDLSITESQISDLQSYYAPGGTDVPVTDGGTGSSTAAGARTNLGLVIGTDVQAYDAGLASIAGLTTAADRMIYTTASDTYAVATLTSFGRSLVDDASASAARTTLGLVIGTDVQAQDAELSAIAGLVSAADRGIYFTGSGTASLFTLTSAARSILDDASTSAIRTTLGVGTGDSPQFTGINLGHASDTTLTRVSAGVMAVEGVTVATASNTLTMTNKTLTSPSISNPTITSDISMNGNNLTDVQRILLDASPDADHTSTGPSTDTINAGATISAMQLCYLASDGEWALADADATSTDGLLAISLEAGTNGNPMDVALPGSFIRDDTWTWTVGGAIYMSTTAGSLTQTAPSGVDDVVRRVGWATHADRMYFMPGDTVTHTG